jgi:hypothetical protein
LQGVTPTTAVTRRDMCQSSDFASLFKILDNQARAMDERVSFFRFEAEADDERKLASQRWNRNSGSWSELRCYFPRYLSKKREISSNASFVSGAPGSR